MPDLRPPKPADPTPAPAPAPAPPDDLPPVAGVPLAIHRWSPAAEPASVGVVRRDAVEQLRRWAVPVDGAWADDFALLLSEVLTNAFRHSGETPTVEVLLGLLKDAVLLEVTDPSPQRPAVVDSGGRAVGGRGMFLVDALSTAWSTRWTARGKGVWFTLALPAPGATEVEVDVASAPEPPQRTRVCPDMRRAHPGGGVLVRAVA